jgi:uncharacterized repeat protein (TIGR03803 family)
MKTHPPTQRPPLQLTPSIPRRNSRTAPLLLAALLLPTLAPAQTVVKVLDLQTGLDPFGVAFGPRIPRCQFTQIGTNLWFTAFNGGANDAGGVFAFDPVTTNVTQLVSLDNITGRNPQSSLTLADGKVWFTTSAGGVDNRGTLVCVETNPPYTLTKVYDFVLGPLGRDPQSTPLLIGDDLWFTTTSGGLAPNGATNYGTVVRYNIPGNFITNAITLDGTNSGRGPLGNSIVPIAGEYWFMTFSGGTNTSLGTPNGAGILGKFSIDANTNAVFTQLADLPAGNPGRHLAFPGGNPVWDGGDFVYFTTAGVSTNPGALGRYQISSGSVTSLFNFVTNAVARTNFGAQPYSTPLLYNNALYFTTLSGGTSNFGTFVKFDLTSNTLTKLADFERNGGAALGASPQYHSGTFYTNPATGRISMYWPINRGGLNGSSPFNGTIIRLDLPPPPVKTTATTDGDFILLSWTGGYSPFSIDRTEDLASGVWQTNWLTGLTTNAISLPLTGAQAFFRVISTNQ